MRLSRSDGTGLGLAFIGHVLLFALLTFGIAHRQPPRHFEAQPIDVQMVDAVGLQSAAPTPATEAPQQQTAPEVAAPEEAQAAPPPTPTPPTPKPREAPAPSPLPSLKPQKVETAKATKPDLKLSSSLLKDLSATAKAEGKAQRSAGSRLGPDFLKGIDSASAGKGTSARAPISGAAMNGLSAAIFRQVKPCYDLGPLGGTPAMKIITTFRLRYNSDGTPAGTPQMMGQEGVDASNRAYAKQMEDVGRRAVLRCQPLKLPSELYDVWKDFPMRFIPEQMG